MPLRTGKQEVFPQGMMSAPILKNGATKHHPGIVTTYKWLSSLKTAEKRCERETIVISSSNSQLNADLIFLVANQPHRGPIAPHFYRAIEIACVKYDLPQGWI